MTTRALATDRDLLPELLRATTNQAIEFLAGLDTRPVARSIPPIPPHGLPEHAVGAAAALELLRTRYAPWISGSAGPRYFGFVTGGATPAALIGDWLTSTFDQNLADAGESSARQLARDALAMVRDLIGLPDAFGGAFVTGATSANTVALATARQWVGSARGIDVAEDGVHALRGVVVLSGAPHASISKAMSIVGLGRAAVRRVATLPGREAIDVDALAVALDEVAAAGAGPAIVVANAGTADTCDFDDLVAIAALRERHRFWLHVDGAFGAIAAASPRFRHLLAGLAAADSVTVDAHKWLNVPYDTGVLLSRHLSVQGDVFRSSAAYLPVEVRADTFLHLTPENSQRLRALPVWMTLAAYGREGYAEVVERCCDLARQLGDRIAGDPRLRMLAPVRLNGICFALAEGAPTGSMARLLDHLRDDGVVFCTPTRFLGVEAARISITNWRTQPHDVELAWQAIQRATEVVAR